MEGIEFADRGGEDRFGSRKWADYGFAESNLGIVYSIAFEKLQDLLGRLESFGVVRAVGNDANPDSDNAGDSFFVTETWTVFPTEANEINGGPLDLFLVKNPSGLGRKC